ncbi:MAG: DUF3553 domain-containing protein [Kofleriaceae bacterium]
MDEVTVLLEQLVENPDDAGLLAVLGDVLEGRGDSRGELIAMQLGIKQSSLADAVAIGRRREELIAQHTPELVQLLRGGEKFVWGAGYIRRFELGMRTGNPMDVAAWLDDPTGREVIADALAELWAHPSMQLLQELVATAASAIALFAINPPHAVRVLTIARGSPADIEALGELVAKLPHLQRIQVLGDPELDRLVHPTVATVAIDSYSTVSRVADLSRARLPGLRRLEIHHRHHARDPLDEVLEYLARGGLLDRLTHLTLPNGELSMQGVTALAGGLGTRTLTRLELGDRDPIPRHVSDALAKLTDELVALVAPEATTAVEHANKPEWGRGTIVRRYDNKIEIEFANAGTKVFKADAAFLRYV